MHTFLSIAIVALSALQSGANPQQGVPLTAGMVIDGSITVRPGIPRDTFALVAEGTANLPPGDSVITLISDDGERVWVDAEEVIDAWSPHESKVDHATIRGGRKKFKVEYYEAGGFAELRFDIQRR